MIKPMEERAISMESMVAKNMIMMKEYFLFMVNILGVQIKWLTK